MPSLSKGIIEKFDIPDGFKIGTQFDGGLGSSWLRTCTAHSNEKVQISLFYRGTRLSATAASGFRRLLRAPGVVIASKRDMLNSHQTLMLGTVSQTSLCANEEQEQQTVKALGSTLGNAFNNQIINKQVGTAGPKFFLNYMAVRDLHGKNVLIVGGHFHDYAGLPESQYLGIFIDASGDLGANADCKIEEIIFEAPDEGLLNKYFKSFLNSLNDVTWSTRHQETDNILTNSNKLANLQNLFKT